MHRVEFTRHLVRFFPTLAAGEFAGATLAEVLASVERAYPGISGYLQDERGALRTHVNVFVGDELHRDRARLSDPLPPGVTISIFQALSGG